LSRLEKREKLETLFNIPSLEPPFVSKYIALRRLLFVICATSVVSQSVGARADDSSSKDIAAIRESSKSDQSFTEHGALTLDKALRFAVENNFEVQTAKEKIERQSGVRIEARSARLPSIDVISAASQVDTEKLPNFGGQTFGSRYSWSIDLRVSQQLFTGGRNSALHERARLLEDAARFDLQTVINDVLLRVREKFLSVLVAREQVRVQELNLKLLEEELASEKNRFDAGTVSQFNVLRAEVALANARTPLIQAREDLKLAHQELRQIMGKEYGEQETMEDLVEIEGELKFIPSEIDLRSALSTAQLFRPELKRLALQKDADRELVTATKAEFFPTISAYGGYGVEKTPFSDDFDDSQRGWMAGVESRWNLFNSLGTKGRLKQAKSELTLTRLNERETKLGIDTEVRRSFALLVEARERVQASRKVVDQAEESLRLVKARLEAGSAIQLEVLDSQVALLEARKNEIQALYDYNIGLSRLYKSMGQSESYVTH
jgi:outer membrane protein TolC